MSASTDFEPQRRARALIEALPYIQKFQGAIVVVKYGGHAMVDPELSMGFARDIVLLNLVGMQPVIVHGGGPQITEMMQRLGMQSEFHEGLRVTDADTLEVVRMVLVGKIGRDIVRAVQVSGGSAVGISGEDGGLITVVPKSPELGYVGDVAEVDPYLIEELLDSGMIPVVSSIGADEQGQAYNINADTVASALSAALKATKLIYLTDVDGLFAEADDPSSLLSTASVAEVSDMIDGGVITGGMIPKVESCLAALQEGVSYVHILNGCTPNAVLLEILTDSGIGTLIT
ncbi:MAG: acetylglutamate kinase [Acidimicrobiaceae bacterium]|nr:acetylglutamate kinase [Acidimicrobiaceae bacterium]